MPNLIEIPIDLAALTASPFKSAVFPLNNAQRVTLEVQTGAGSTAGQWVLKTVSAPDVSIGGQILITVNFPGAAGRVASGSADVAHKWGYVEQITPIATAALQKVSVYLR